MKNEVHIFLAKATSLKVENFAAGERHALHIYLRQPINSDYDSQSAEQVALNDGWSDIDLIQASTLSEPIEIKQEILRQCYDHALANGYAILVYADIEN